MDSMIKAFGGSQDIDYLTKLPNRYSFEFAMKKALHNAKTEKAGYVIQVDINDFRIINQGYGYDAGDLMIISLARFLKNQFDTSYAIFRMNSDSFILLCNTIFSPEQLDNDTETIIRRFQSPWSLGNEVVYCTVSVSAVYYPTCGRTVEELYRNLDSALYKAKDSGNNVCVVYREEIENISNIVMKHREIEKMLRDAVKCDFKGFQLHFQPIYNSATDQLIGAEALLRFTNEKGISISPGLFVPLAENTGLIIPIGEFVLKTAALFCKSMVDGGHPDFCVSINVSIHQWQLPDFYKTVADILNAIKVPPGNLILEITESVAATNMERIRETCGLLRQLGVQIALDDFGSGYSSLNMIRTMPIDLIKIDRAFVNDIVFDDFTHLFMRLITELGHVLGITVCAEGVEETEQLSRCKRMGVDYIQGYIYNKAMPVQVFIDMMRTEGE